MHRCAEIVPIHILTPRLQLPVEEVKCRLQNQAFPERSRQSWTEGRDGVNEVTDGRSERILHVVRLLCMSRRKESAKTRGCRVHVACSYADLGWETRQG